ncbi:MAG: HEAT repeat domain-containing protein [Pirellulaceae bacterium]
MTTSDASRPDRVAEPVRKPPSGELPPIEPPTVGFILQLFVIPLVIVSIIVVVWLLFNWLAHMGTNPTELVRDLRKMNDASWQKALTLADLLRNPQSAELKRDAALAKEVAAVLEDQLDKAPTDDSNLVQLRVFLCRALGEFEVADVLPTLLRAAGTQRAEQDLQVRRSAVQSLAVYIDHNEPAELQQQEELVEVLLRASREQQNPDPEFGMAELRSTAAYALGMLGGEQVQERLVTMLDDGYPNARFNAALALCRHGDERALPVLLEMLDPESDEAVRHETAEEGKPWKRLLVLQNGIRAAQMLATHNATADLSQLVEALNTLAKSELSKLEPGTRRGVHMEAQEAVLKLGPR